MIDIMGAIAPGVMTLPMRRVADGPASKRYFSSTHTPLRARHCSAATMHSFTSTDACWLALAIVVLIVIVYAFTRSGDGFHNNHPIRKSKVIKQKHNSCGACRASDEEVRNDLANITAQVSPLFNPGISERKAKEDAMCMANRAMKNGRDKAVGSITIGCLQLMGQTHGSTSRDPNGPANPPPVYNYAPHKVSPATQKMCAKYYTTTGEAARAIHECHIKSKTPA